MGSTGYSEGLQGQVLYECVRKTGPFSPCPRPSRDVEFDVAGVSGTGAGGEDPTAGPPKGAAPRAEQLLEEAAVAGRRGELHYGIFTGCVIARASTVASLVS